MEELFIGQDQMPQIQIRFVAFQFQFRLYFSYLERRLDYCNMVIWKQHLCLIYNYMLIFMVY
jgi:hypothetical protein